MPEIIAIAGGIGSGKSVVSAILRTMGYPVYDCDSRAKSLMRTDGRIKNDLLQYFGQNVFLADGNTIDTKYLSSVVFNEPSALARLNAIVHPRVREDFVTWARESGSVVFVETAILKESGMDELVDAVWHVTAPEHERIRRVMLRNGLKEQEVMNRIRNQRPLGGMSRPVIEINNDGEHSVLMQISSLVDALQRNFPVA